MFAAKLPFIAPLALTSLLATGCYCPMLSGRYGELGCCPPCPLPPAAPVENCEPVCQQGGRSHRACFLGGWLGFGGRQALGRGEGAVPSQQGPDYVSPQAKFHPCPTRPVFEPQLVYPPPQLIETADSNPLRPADGKLLPLRSQQATNSILSQPQSR
jgi:hypothetical protein